jgi:hypothetical protein
MIVLLLNFGEQKSDYVWNNEVAFACNAIWSVYTISNRFGDRNFSITLKIELLNLVYNHFFCITNSALQKIFRDRIKKKKKFISKRFFVGVPQDVF